jgi:alcohol dehydrogenase (NADP+)
MAAGDTSVGSTPYNGEDKPLGGVTYGGYSESIVVDEGFVLKVSENLNLAAVAPLLCAGITTYSPLRHWKVSRGQKVGIVGLGGLGHMGVKLQMPLAHTSFSSPLQDGGRAAVGRAKPGRIKKLESA